MSLQGIGTGVALAFICLCILGVMPIIADSRPEGFGALGFAFLLSAWQVVFALPLFARGLRTTDRGIFGWEVAPGERRRTLRVSVFTGVLFGLSTYLYVLGVEKAGPVSAAIAIQAYPLFAILCEAVLLGRRKTLVELVFTAMLVAALYYLGTGGTGRMTGASLWFLAALAVPFLWSIAHVFIKEELGRTPITPAQVTLFRVAVSAVFLGIVVAIVEPAGLVQALLRPEYQLFAMAMGLVYYLELIIWFHAVRHIDVSLASSITTPWPAVTMMLAAIFLADSVEAYQIGAFVVVALSVYGLIVSGFRKERARRN